MLEKVANLQADIDSLLQHSIMQLGIKLKDCQINQLKNYIDHLNQWNKVINLVSRSSQKNLISHHIADSLSVVETLNDYRKVIDLGSGAGLPGIPLAIAMPQCDFVLLDRRSKATDFLSYVLDHLKLTNTSLAHSSIEDYQAGQPAPDAVISRALTPLPSLLRLCDHWLNVGTDLVVMQGKLLLPEKLSHDPQVQVVLAQRLQVPGVEGARHVLVLRRTKRNYPA